MTNHNVSESKVSSIDASRWVAEHGDVLYRYALLRVRDRSVSEELVQETFLAALKGLKNFQGESTERTWLIGILKHKIVDHVRRVQREVPTEEIDAEVDSYFNENGRWAVPPSVMQTPLGNAEQDELRRYLVDCLNTLPQRLSRAFVLTQVDGAATEEACKLLEVSATNLWVMLHRARLRLRQCLESMGWSPST